MSNQEPAARADLIWEANLGRLRADLGEAGALYADTTGQMSTEALALAVKQERLNRVIKNSGAESTAAKAATLAYRRELEALSATQTQVAQTAGQSARAEVDAAVARRQSLVGIAARARGAKAAEEEATASRYGRGIAAGAGGAGRALAFGSTAFIAGIGSVLAVKTVLDAAKNEELAQKLVQNALKDTGQSWDANGAAIERNTSKLVSASGFTKSDVLNSLGLLIRRTGDVGKATDLMGTAIDLARGRGIDLALATGIIIRALNGQVGSLRRAGIEAVKVTTNTDALRASGEKATAAQVAQAKALDAVATQEGIIAAVRAKYGNAAAAYLDTEAGKQALLNARMKESEAVIGRALTPAYDHLLDRTAKYLDHLNKTGQLQKEVDSLIKDGSGFVHELGDAFHFAESTIGPVVHLLGGVEKTAKILIALKFAFIVKGWSTSLQELAGRAGLSFGEIAASGAAATGKVEANAAAMDAELTRATRPREIVITETYVTRGTPGGVGGGGFTGGGSGPKGVVGRVGEYTRTGAPAEPTPPGIAGTGGLSGLVASGFAIGGSGEQGPKGVVAWSQAEDQFYSVASIGKTVIKSKISSATARKLDPAFWTKVENFKRALQRGDSGGASTIAGTAHAPVSTIGRTAPPPPPKTGLSFALQNAQLDAERSKGTGDDLRVYKEEQAAYLKLLAQPGLTHADILQIKQGLNSVTSQIDSIETQSASDAKAAFDKRQSARKQTLATEEAHLRTNVLRAKTPAGTAKAEDAIVAFFKREAKDASNTGKEQAVYAEKAVKERNAQAKRAEEASKKLRAAQIKALETIPLNLQAAVAKAQANNAPDDVLLKLYQREETALKKQEAQLRKNHAGKLAILAVLRNEASVEKQILGITKAKTDSGLANRDQFLSSFRDIVSAYAPNAFPAPGTGGPLNQIATHLYDIKHETRAQTKHLDDIRVAGKFPASAYASRSGEAAFG